MHQSTIQKKSFLLLEQIKAWVISQYHYLPLNLGSTYYLCIFSVSKLALRIQCWRSLLVVSNSIENCPHCTVQTDQKSLIGYLHFIYLFKLSKINMVQPHQVKPSSYYSISNNLVNLLHADKAPQNWLLKKKRYTIPS